MTTVTFSNFNDDSRTHFVSIDRSSLPENMRDFYKIVTGGLDSLEEGLFQLSIISNDRSQTDLGNFNNIEPYDDENGIRTKYYPNMSIKFLPRKFSWVSIAATFPLSITTTRSHSSIVDSLWAIVITVFPFDNSLIAPTILVY